MPADLAVPTERPKQMAPLKILKEDANTNQRPFVEDNVPKDVCGNQPGLGPTLFTIGIPGERLDALPERKSFRASILALPSQATTSSLHLCLRCRQVGHILRDCPYSTLAYYQPLDWTIARAIQSGEPRGDAKQETAELCSRCEGLDIDLHGIADPIENSWPAEFSFQDFERDADWITLGPAATLHFKADCPFCRLLFSITQCPGNGNEELILAKTHSNRRLSNSRYIPGVESSTCAYTTTKPTEADWNRSTVVKLTKQVSDRAMGAICYLSKDCLKSGCSPLPLGGRLVDSFSVDESILCGWLRRCEDLHGQVCRPEYFDELRGIRLVDVDARKIVAYPADHRCDYIALSYVWGKCEQRSYNIGSHVRNLPQTVEDAMTVTKMLRKRYLWVDSLTIDQADSAHKAAQIKLMSSIYRGAWVTIVALSGRSAASGLPRVNMYAKAYPDIIFPQASTTVGDIEIVSTMPTLVQQLRLSKWNTRAWTLQEALLSPRCLYFTQHQVYFQCNTFQCCESIDETTSPPHNQAALATHKFGTGVFQSIFLRAPDNEINPHNGRDWGLSFGLEKFFELLGHYSTREMTSNLDKINAFSGILQALESLYFKKRGFHYGLPVSYLPWSLLWEGECIRPIMGFPSWSWAGWDTSWMYSAPPHSWFKKEFQTYLRIFKPENGLLMQIYHSSPADEVYAEQQLHLISTDPLWPLARHDAEGPPFPSCFSPDADVSNLLFIEGIVLNFVCPSPAKRVEDRTDWELDWKYDEKEIELGGIKCSFRYLLTLEQTLQTRLGQPQTFLVIVRDLYKDTLTYWMLLLDEVDGIMYRHGQVRLSVPYSKNYCIQHANPRRTRLILG